MRDDPCSCSRLRDYSGSFKEEYSRVQQLSWEKNRQVGCVKRGVPTTIFVGTHLSHHRESRLSSPSQSKKRIPITITNARFIHDLAHSPAVHAIPLHVSQAFQNRTDLRRILILLCRVDTHAAALARSRSEPSTILLRHQISQSAPLPPKSRLQVST